MKGITIFFLLFAALFRPAWSQNYIRYLNTTSEAEWHFDNNRYKEAISLFETAFEMVDLPLYKDVWMYSVIQSKQGKSEKSIRYLKQFFKHRRILNTWGNNLIKTITTRDSVNLTERQIAKLSSYMIDSTDQDFILALSTRRIIDSLYIMDQRIRKIISSNLDSCWWKTGLDSTFINSRKKAIEIDSLNAQTIIALIESDRIVNNSLINGPNFGHLLLHMQYENFIRIEQKLIEMIDMGNLDPWDFARAKDRKYTENGDCLNFFAYTFTTTNYTCLSHEQVIENRKSIGLSIYYSRPSFSFYIKPYSMMKIPFEEYLSDFGIKAK